MTPLNFESVWALVVVPPQWLHSHGRGTQEAQIAHGRIKNPQVSRVRPKQARWHGNWLWWPDGVADNLDKTFVSSWDKDLCFYKVWLVFTQLSFAILRLHPGFDRRFLNQLPFVVTHVLYFHFEFRPHCCPKRIL